MKHALRVVLIVATTFLTAVASAQPVVVDGNFDPAEWAGATTYPVTINLPEGGTTPGTYYVRNDSTDLYVALRYQRTTIDMITRGSLMIDWQGQGLATEGNDGFGHETWACGQSSFWDGYVTALSPYCPGYFCLGNDWWNGGTTDGASAVGRDGVWMTQEMRHPLYSGDMDDMAVKPGTTLVVYFYSGLVNTAPTATYSQLIEKYTVQ